jgi:signal peptidase II
MAPKQRLYLRLLAIAAAVVAVDQLTKQLALNYLRDGPVDLIPGALSLSLTFNPGGAFGFGQNAPLFFLLVSLAIIVVILVWVGRTAESGFEIPLGLVLGGGIGNVADRVFRGLDGRVVDFIDIHVWPVFNLADSAIVIGVIVIAFAGFFPKRRSAEE